MAISLKTAGTYTGSSTPTLVGTPAAGDRYFVWAGWKPYTVATTPPSGWNLISEYADGTVAMGNGLGSMKVACWYRDWQSGDGNPVIGISGPDVFICTMQLWQKGAGETWDTPLFQTGPWPDQISGLAAATSGATNVPTGSVVMAAIVGRDDSATLTRPADGIDINSGGAITWNGNYVESPASHNTSTTGNDMFMDLGHRFVTTGGTARVLEINITTLTATETGAVLWVVQGVTTPGANTSLSPRFNRSNYGSLLQL